MNLLLLGLMTGIDNFIVRAGLGAARLGRKQIITLVGLFALAEACMPMLGFYLSSVVAPGLFEGLGPILVILAGLIAAYRVYAGLPKLSPWFLFSVPLIMSFDNLAAGAGIGAISGGSFALAAGAGLTAAILTIAGLALGRVLPLKSPALAQSFLALALVSVGMFELVAGA